VRVAFEVELTSPKGQILAEVVNAYGKFELLLDTDGASWLSHYQPDKLGNVSSKPTGQDLLKDVPLTVDRRYKVELLIFDGMAYARINQAVRRKARLHHESERHRGERHDRPADLVRRAAASPSA
jgi:hypothetical protein